VIADALANGAQAEDGRRRPEFEQRLASNRRRDHPSRATLERYYDAFEGDKLLPERCG
jgi:hypothetical protein